MRYTGARRRAPRWLRFIMVGIVVVALSVVLCSFYTVLRVSGNSMNPTYISGQLLTARWGSDFDMNYPVCWVRLSDGSNVIKRLIGRPGDTVSLVDGDTYVNGVLIMKRQTASWDNQVFVLGEDQYLFLGDNREASIDARFWPQTFVSKDQILAYVVGSDLQVGD